MNYLLLMLSLPLPQTGYAQQPDALERAKGKIEAAQYITFTTMGYWPGTDGVVDTSTSVSGFHRNVTSILGFDFWLKNDLADGVYEQQLYSVVEHDKRQIWTEEMMNFARLEGYAERIKSSTIVKYSPIGLMDDDWTYYQDSLVDGEAYAVYRKEWLSERGNTLAENLWIHQDQATIYRHDWISYLEDGSEKQHIMHVFSDYTLSRKPRPFAYSFPEGYTYHDPAW